MPFRIHTMPRPAQVGFISPTGDDHALSILSSEKLDLAYLNSTSSPTPFTFDRRIKFHIHRRNFGSTIADRNTTHKNNEPTRSIVYYNTAYRAFLQRHQSEPSHLSLPLTSTVFSACFGEFLSDCLRIPPFITTAAAQQNRNDTINLRFAFLLREMQLFREDKNPLHIANMKKIYKNLGMDLTTMNSEMLRINLNEVIQPILHLLSRNEIALVADTLRLIYLGKTAPTTFPSSQITHRR